MSPTQSREKPITEGYLAGGAALIVAILWLVLDAFNPVIIFTLYVIAIFCLSISTLWLLSKEKTIKEWLSGQPARLFTTGFVGLFFILTSVFLLYYK
jgi:NADH:ubiquinone oxidoreductase subunit 6 (subunit J)